MFSALRFLFKSRNLLTPHPLSTTTTPNIRNSSSCLAMTKGHRSKHYYSNGIPAIIASAPVEPMTPWSDWVLHSSGLYYYRGRKISWNLAQTVEDSRNSVVSDGEGGYLHYEFMGIREVPRGYFTHATTSTYEAAAQPCSMPLPESSYEAPQKQQQQLLLKAPEVYEDDDSASGISGNSGAGSAKKRLTVIDVDDTPDGLKITFPDDHFIVSERKSKRRSGSDKKYRISHKAKVEQWL